MDTANGTVTPRDSLEADIDIEAYLLRELGPKQIPFRWPVTTVYSVIFLTGLVGNVCTCLVIGRNQYMQTATNCYLFNLALADTLTLLLAMPPELYTFWQQYPWQLGSVGCWFRGLIPEATAYASILTIVTFSAERYVAICHPLQQQARSTLSNAVRNIGLIWAASTLCALPFAFFTRVNELRLPGSGKPIPESRWCAFPFNRPQWIWEVPMVWSTLVFFVVPITLITVLYVRIALALRRSSRHLLHRSATSEGATTERERSKTRSRRVVVRMLAAVVIAFFVCWAPFHAQRLLFLYVTLYGEWTDTLKHINQILFTSAGCFYYFNSTINPILYSVMSNRFRVAFREKLCAGPPSLWCICCCCFCCVKDFEKRSHQQLYHPTTQAPVSVFCRNSNSHSSVRSCVSYKTNAVNNNTTRPPSRMLAVDYNQKSGATLSSVHEGTFKYGPTLSVSQVADSRSSDSPVSGRGGEADLAVELNEAIRPELDKLEEKTDCISCTNCSLLFPSRPPRGGDPVDRTSTTDLSLSEQNENKTVKESLV